ncbi:helix-turn-helix transcriptional regulator [Microbacterium sp. NPDC088619]|uniref:helix-turn-helix transcriptional regulator n=1 Tax=Microbacterium sp. NPDC088619 TaxID=3364196 RepID=UPI0038111AE2
MHWEDGFRANMKSAREAIGMTQTDLAHRLKDMGLPFHQQTVQRVETGLRPVRLDEAFAIAMVLGVIDMKDMVDTETSVTLEAVRGHMRRHRRDLESAIQEYEQARASFAALMDQIPESEQKPWDAEIAESTLAMTAETIAQDWRERNPDFAAEVFERAEGRWQQLYRGK